MNLDETFIEFKTRINKAEKLDDLLVIEDQFRLNEIFWPPNGKEVHSVTACARTSIYELIRNRAVEICLKIKKSS